jgi:hypothetical protein
MLVMAINLQVQDYLALVLGVQALVVQINLQMLQRQMQQQTLAMEEMVALATVVERLLVVQVIV